MRVSRGLAALVGLALLVFVASAFGEDTAIGEYINPLHPDDCLEIGRDGSCYIEILGLNMGTTGRWKIEGARLSLVFPDGTTIRGTVKTEAILLEGFGMLPLVWIKSTKNSPGLADVAGRYVKEGDPDEVLFLNRDRTYTKTERGVGDQLWTSSGEWKLDGHAVRLFYLGDRTLGISAAVLENRLYFTGLFGTDVWIGERREEPMPVSPVPSPEEVPPSGKPPEVEWEKTFGTGSADYGIGVQELDEGGYVVLAVTMPEVSTGGQLPPETWVIRTDEAGVIMWDRRLAGGRAIGNFIQQTRDGRYVVVGTTIGTPGGDSQEAAWLAKLDRYGNIEWEQVFGGPEGWYGELGEAYGTIVRETDDGGYIFVGEAQRSVREADVPDVGDVWLVKVDRSGNKEWERFFTGHSRDIGIACEQTSDGGYIVAGQSVRGAGWDAHEDVWLIKTDPQGRKQWERFFGGESTDSVGCVRVAGDGGYIVVGAKGAPEVWVFNLWLIKTDAAGTDLRPCGGTTWRAGFD